MSRLSAVLTLPLLAVLGCSTDTSGATARDGDAEMFATEIQPILRRQCAFLGCHGREGMPLTLYTLDYLRLRDIDGDVDPTTPVLDERALFPSEIDHNRLSLSSRVGRDDPAGDIERLLLRMIPTEAGGIPHGDVVVYESANDPEMVKLRQFLETVK
jgi:hypothetical protein